MSTYAVIFNYPPALVGPFQKVEDIFHRQSFPVPKDLLNPEDWEIIGPEITRPVDGTSYELTGKIARWVG